MLHVFLRGARSRFQASGPRGIMNVRDPAVTSTPTPQNQQWGIMANRITYG